MFNKAIFKQTVKANRVLWLIVTGVLTLILTLIIFQFDPTSMQELMNMLQGAGLGSEVAGDSLLSSSITILGILSQSFYTMIAIIIMLVYIIITANNLVAGEVDRGSMAYTLSTPVTRTSVIFTKAMFLISSLLLMVTIFSLAGIFSVQIKYQLIWGTAYPTDVKAIVKDNSTTHTKQELNDDYNIILSSKDYVTIGADSRNVSIKTFEQYVEIRAFNKAVESSANYLGIKVNDEDIYKKILASPDAINAGSSSSHIPFIRYRGLLNIMDNNSSSGGSNNDEFLETFETVYTELNIAHSLSEAIAKLEVILEREADIYELLGNTEGTIFIMVVRLMSVNQLISQDESITFNTGSFLKLNIGLFLLMFATSGISFIASTIFNLSKHSFALGAGLPLIFWVLQIVANIDSSLEPAKYFSLNTLYNSSNLIKANGPFIWEFIILFTLGIILYVSSIFIFNKKDLPL